ncbi:DTW domain-containing protein [Clostridiaceae bacterium UIB06]|uniref:tRNA-uridine aminocarboxypropyltransferase n=1 Tax=Clostridium thailandense TaxID=2794346 RepID=A0A949X4D5_9CLOT|nr:tRNA-uridine aminocarboxypropyltransferase [Clostridium thailandense]MBV7276289.1 DTW domain-containing protein [Clostridium thailandense]MCH5138065.1 DTW domain-containing protein [Clostridiaceae bacterium UIB06]
MPSEYKIKQITSLYQSCSKCGLPIINCICDKSPKVETRGKIWILSNEREFSRPSNTARILKLINSDSTEIFIWERTKEPKKLIENIQDERYETYLLFPAEGELESRKVEYKRTEKIPAFIIIDGTWKEARKIVRKSEYLKNLKVLSLNPYHKSVYSLRKGAEEGNLCTIESAIEILKLSGETENVRLIGEFFNLFLKSYKAGINGHELK